MKSIRLISLTTLLFILSNSYAQDKVVDSLENVLKNYSKKDTTRVNLLNSIATKIFASDTERALKILKESEILADNLDYKKGQAYSFLFTGNTLLNKSDYNNALHYFQKAQDIYKKLKNKEGLANCYFNFGRSYYYLGEYNNALESYKNAIILCEETGDLKRLSSSLVGVGVIYTKNGDYEKSMENYKRALQIDEKLGNKKGIGNTLISLGTLYKHQGKYTLALESYNKSLEIKEKLGDQNGVAANYENIGTLYAALAKDPEALEYYKKALNVNEKIKNPKKIIASLTNIGIVYMNNGNEILARETFDKALSISTKINDQYDISNCYANLGSLEFINKKYNNSIAYFDKAIKILKQLNVKRDLSYCYLKLGKVYQAKTDYEKALNYANQSMEIAKELDLIDFQRDLSLLISEINYDNKNYKLAYENSLIHKKLNDSIFNKENLDSISQIKYKYAYKDTLTSAKNNVNSLKNTVKTIDTKLEASQQKTKWLIIAFVGLLILLGFLMALLKIRKVKAQNQQLLLEQKLLITQMNPHFIYNSIDTIQSLIYNKQDQEAVNYLEKFSRLTRQILENSNENYILLTEEIEMIENYLVIQQLLYSNKFDFEITVENTIEAESIFLPPMLTQPFIENAIKHGLANQSEKGKIDITFYLKESKLFFQVSDNGNGFDFSKKTENHKSLAMKITKERLVNYSKNQDFVIVTNNIIDDNENVTGAKVVFEIPYIYEK